MLDKSRLRIAIQKSGRLSEESKFAFSLWHQNQFTTTTFDCLCRKYAYFRVRDDDIRGWSWTVSLTWDHR